MTIRVDVKRSSFFKELDVLRQKEFFDLSYKKIIPHIDTLYYTVSLEDDIVGQTSEKILEMVDFLNECKLQVQNNKDDMWLYYEDDILYRNRTFKLYNHCLGKEGFFDIFVATKLPNSNTPRVFIQLRSIGLWTIGEYELIQQSYKALMILLNEFDIKVKDVCENRIDYCYHTNLIQNPLKFFGDNTLMNNLKSNLKIYMKVGQVAPRELTIDYLSLGSRNSKNVFFRTYNKVKEVINMNYKGFFIEYWFNENLISYYDYFVYMYAYNKQNYDYIWEGMAQFYIKYGSNLFLKQQLIKLIDTDTTTFDDMKKFVLRFMPKTTYIVNIEFQTMRKFYYHGNDLIETLPIDTKLDEFKLLRLFRIIDNRKLFLDYLTENSVCFVKDNLKDFTILDFWKRIRNVKLTKHYKGKYVRVYPVQKVDEQKIVNKLKKELAKLSIVKNNLSSDLNEDMSLLFGVLNDNDVKFNNDGVITIIDEKYNKIKDREKKKLKSLIKKDKKRENV